jgi:alpha-1,3-rhamnosyl/mannosyltransferase
VPLVLAGGWGWKMESLPDSLAQHGLLDDTRLIGYQSDTVLAALYSLCTALVWPTFYEGFGLPPLEAMACGAAVISSTATSIPEVVGDAGVLLDPSDVPAWTEALRRISEDDSWRDDWARRGAARAATFSWSRCADETIACYRAALAARG